jgi:hypothetical protein
MGIHVAQFRHIVLISSQSVFAHTLYKCCKTGKEAANINFLDFGLTKPVLKGGKHTKLIINVVYVNGLPDKKVRFVKLYM